jgi:hypothetical protein
MMLEIDRHAGDVDGQDRDQLAVDVIGDAAKSLG